MRRALQTVLLAVVALSTLTGCATSFSAPMVRAEIARQTGAEPRESFGLYAGPATMAVLRRVLGDAAVEDASPAGSRITGFELAVYEYPPKSAGALDFTRLPVRDWEPSLRFNSEGRSGVVLLRTSGETIADLVVLASDEEGAIYGRLRGTLSKELPAALGKVIREGGSGALEDELKSMPRQ